MSRKASCLPGGGNQTAEGFAEIGEAGVGWAMAIIGNCSFLLRKRKSASCEGDGVRGFKQVTRAATDPLGIVNRNKINKTKGREDVHQEVFGMMNYKEFIFSY